MVRNDVHYNCPCCDKEDAGNLRWKNIGRHVKKDHPLKWVEVGDVQAKAIITVDF